MKCAYSFPATKWVESVTMHEQWRKMAEEVVEVDEALYSYRFDDGDLLDVAIETIDVIHACETMLRMLEGAAVCNGCGVRVGEGLIAQDNDDLRVTIARLVNARADRERYRDRALDLTCHQYLAADDPRCSNCERPFGDYCNDVITEVDDD